MAAFARTHRADIESAGHALTGARRSRIHLVLATSALHMEKKLRLDPQDVVRQARWAAQYAAERADEVEFSCEDATRSDPAFVAQVCRVAIEAGATIINLPDTVGFALPAEYAGFLADVRNRCPEIRGVTLSVHCHNDLGLAVANSLAGIQAGAQQVECTVNGIGERAGNASLEEIVMALHVRGDQFGIETGINTAEITAASKLVSALTGYVVQPNKAVVGANAFAHASGIHQDGVIKDPGTYEIMTPQSVGWEARRIVVSKLSGRRGLQARLTELGLPLEGEALDRAYILAMKRGDEVHELDERDLIAIAAEARRSPTEPTFTFVPASTPAD